MRLEGRRESDNVEDRRGMSSGAKAGVGGGLLGIIIALAVMFLGGGLGGNGGGGGLGDILGGGGGGGLGGIDIGDVLGNAMGGSSSTGSQSQSPTQFTEEEQALYKFSSQILAGTLINWIMNRTQFSFTSGTYPARRTASAIPSAVRGSSAAGACWASFS